MNQFPKMLYKGTKKDYKPQIAHDVEHESVLKEQGWTDYGELPESSLEQLHADGWTGSAILAESAESSKTQEVDLTAFVPVEQFDELAEKLAQSESEVARLNGVIKNGMEENEQLRGRIAELEKPAEIGIPNSNLATLDPSSMTADQLRALLDEKGIAYKARDSKPELIELLNGHSNG